LLEKAANVTALGSSTGSIAGSVITYPPWCQPLFRFLSLDATAEQQLQRRLRTPMSELW